MVEALLTKLTSLMALHKILSSGPGPAASTVTDAVKDQDEEECKAGSELEEVADVPKKALVVEKKEEEIVASSAGGGTDAAAGVRKAFEDTLMELNKWVDLSKKEAKKK